MAGPIRVTVVADASDAVDGFRDVVQAAQSTEDRLDAAGRAGSAWADKADFAGGAAAKLAGGIGDVADGLAKNGIISEAAAEKADQVAKGLMVVAGAADIATTANALYSAAQTAGGVAALRAAVASKAQAAGTVIMSGVTKAAAAAQWLFNAAMTANPIGLVVLAIVALVAIFVLAYTKSETFRKIVDAAFQGIKTVALAVFDFLKGYFIFMFDLYKSIFEAVWNAIKATVMFVWNAISAYFTFIFNIYKAIFNAFISAVKAIWNGITWLWDKAVAVFNGIKTAVGTAVGWVQTKIQEVVARVLAVWAGILGMVAKVTELRDRIISTVSGLIDKFLGFGKDIMRGLADGIQAGIQWVKDKVKGLGGMIPDWLKSVLGISSPSKVLADLGRSAMQGLTKGLESQVPALENTLGTVTDAIAGLDADPTVTLTANAALDGGPLGGSAGGGASYAITVNVAPGGDPAEAGRLVVKAIEAWERRTGKRRLVTA